MLADFQNVKAHSIDFSRLREVARLQAATLIKAWLPDGKREGDEWVALNPTRADKHPGSFKINMTNGSWADFATGDRGTDLIALRAYLDGSSQGEAARRLAGELGIVTADRSGLTLERYAAAKKLPVDFLRKLGLETVPDPWGKSRQVLNIPYRKKDGSLYRWNTVRDGRIIEGSPC